MGILGKALCPKSNAVLEALFPILGKRKHIRPCPLRGPLEAFPLRGSNEAKPPTLGASRGRARE